MKSVILSTKNLTIGYDHPILSNICLEIPQGHLCALIGPNGAGKTTLLKAFVGLLKPLSGTIERFGSYAYVSQYAQVDWSFPLTVVDVVLMGSYIQIGFFKRPSEREREHAYAMLALVGMSDYAQKWIGELSGGQRQRILIARALMQNADVLFLDEPFSAVDKITEEALIQVFYSLVARGKTIVMVHHDVMTVRKVSDWVVLINRSVIAHGRPEIVLTPDALQKTYGGYIA